MLCVVLNLFVICRGVLRIHPSFRMIALAEPPKAGSTSQQWLNPELLTLFFYHHMAPLSIQYEMEIIQTVVMTLLNIILKNLKEIT